MNLTRSTFGLSPGPSAPWCSGRIVCHRPSNGAFSVIEILVVVTLISVIILGLVAMFSQTQRAFRTGMTQTDVLESGRMATDMISRELEQITPSYQDSNAPNFLVWLPLVPPLVQALPGSTFPRTNICDDVFFLTRRNQDWVGIGYFVREGNPTTGVLSLPPAGVGTLYRFETNAPALSGLSPAHLYAGFLAARANEAGNSKILDGVQHFRLNAYNTNGDWILFDRDISASGTQTNSDVRLSSIVPDEIGFYSFYSNAVPASVEMELGILEDRAWERFKSLPDAASQYRYVTNQVGRVHLFRQRVPIRNVDPIAYR